MNHNTVDSSFADHMKQAGSPAGLGFAVLTLSDTRDESSDRSGAYLRKAIPLAGHEVAFYRVVKDDETAIHSGLDAALDNPRVQVIVSNGGTGIAYRDSAYEVYSQRLEKRLDGFGEIFRSLSFAEIGSAAMLSRAIAGTIGRQVLFALPGSTNAVKLGFDQLICPQAAHLIHELNKDRQPPGTTNRNV